MSTKEYPKTMEAIGPDSKKVVIKKIRISESEKLDISRITELIQRINSWEHHNLIKYIAIDYNKHQKELILITEHCPYTLKDMSQRKFDKWFKFKEVVKVILQVLKKLYSEGVYNANLKSENILFTKTGQLKLRDYLAQDYLNYLSEGKPFLIRQNELQNFARDTDFTNLAFIIKDYYKIYDGAYAANNITRSLNPFLKILSENSQIPPEKVDFEQILKHDWLNKQDDLIISGFTGLIMMKTDGALLRHPNDDVQLIKSQNNPEREKEDDPIKAETDFALLVEDMKKRNHKNLDPTSSIQVMSSLAERTETVATKPTEEKSEQVIGIKQRLKELDRAQEDNLKKMMELMGN